MSEFLDAPVNKMLQAFGMRISAERIDAFVQAIIDHELCERCAERACRSITGGFTKHPFPAHLVEETRDVMASAEHSIHVSDRRALSSGDIGAWWVTEGSVMVKKAWPELQIDQAQTVAKFMFALGYIEPTWASIAAELGYVDERGATTEREWWMKTLPELVMTGGDDPRYV